MTRKSRREIERELSDMGGTDGDGPTELVIEETTVGTEWAGSDLDAEETETTREVVRIQ